MRPIRVALLVLIGGAAYIHAPVETRDGLPVPDIPGYRTLKGAFHLHTVSLPKVEALLQDKRGASFGDRTTVAEAAKRAIAAISQLR